jgi:hypothetical protein
LKSFSELHRVCGRNWDGVRVDMGERVVHDGAWSSVALRHYPKGAQAEVGQVLDEVVRYQSPLAFGNHCGEFGLEKFDVGVSGLMGAAK